LDPEDRATSKRGTEQRTYSTSNANKFQSNEPLLFETRQSNQNCFKKDSLFVHKDKTNSDKSWPKNRILQPAKSTPSLLRIDDEQIASASVDLPSPHEGLRELNNVEYLPTNFNGK
jgi:hypothetical protein